MIAGYWEERRTLCVCTYCWRPIRAQLDYDAVEGLHVLWVHVHHLPILLASQANSYGGLSTSCFIACSQRKELTQVTRSLWESHGIYKSKGVLTSLIMCVDRFNSPFSNRFSFSVGSLLSVWPQFLTIQWLVLVLVLRLWCFTLSTITHLLLIEKHPESEWCISKSNLLMTPFEK